VEQYLPSKRFIVSVIILLALGASGWFVAQNPQQETISSNQSNGALLQQQRQAEILAITDRLVLDNDKDGLRDWEEVIWKTDPQIPDTDGDGTTDGEEVKLERDPLKAGPDDLLEKHPIDENKKNEPQTLTEQLMDDLRLSYLAAHGLNEGAPLSEEQKSDIVSSFMATMQQEQERAQHYSMTDIKIDVSKTGKAYGNELGAALDAQSKNIDYSELDVMKEITSTMSKEQMRKVLEKLDPLIARYETIIALLQNMSVPLAYADMHTQFLNINAALKKAAEDMRALPDDPIRSSLGIGLFREKLDSVLVFLRGLKAQFEKDNIRFSPNEPGSFFYQYF